MKNYQECKELNTEIKCLFGTRETNQASAHDLCIGDSVL